MGFNEDLMQLSERIMSIKNSIVTEEATKMSMIVPFFQLLGYDVFNPTEFCPEYVADVGIKKGEKIDYAIIINQEPVILVECKSCTEELTKHASQLFRYFSTSPAKFGILTNGITYKFYTDLEEANKMDLVPFLEFDITNIKEYLLGEIKKFSKENFDRDKIFNTAEELKYSSMVKSFIASEFENPSEDFIRLILSNIYEGQKNQKVIEKFTPVIKKAFSSFVNELVNNKISSALANNASEEDTETTDIPPQSKVVTTEEELEGYYIVRGILAGTIPVEDVVHRDTESYFGILYKDNNRKPLCRLNFNRKNKQLLIPDAEKNFTKYTLESLNDIYKYREQLIEVANFYI